MEILLDPEELLTCPYEKSHHIRRKRMAVHLVKCKKNHTNLKMVECDFNITHKVPEAELQFHHESCPDRKHFEVAVTEDLAVDEDKYPVQNKVVDWGESWDDFNVPSYNPEAYCERADVLRQVKVESASVRKQFRLQERRRINTIANSESNKQPQEDLAKKLPSRKREVQTQEGADVLPDAVRDMMERIKISQNKTFVSKVNGQ